MFRIIKPGKEVYRVIRFDCPHCACVFETDEFTKKMTVHNDIVVSACCPFCSNMAYTTLGEKNEN